MTQFVTVKSILVDNLDGLSIKQVIEKFKEWPEDYFVDIRADYADSWNSEDKELYLDILRIETDEEKLSRINLEKVKKEEQRLRDIDLAKRLLQNAGVELPEELK